VSVYTEKGYRDRHEYLRNVALDHGIPLRIVLTLAALLGPDEDFDGLIPAVEDYVEEIE
jgi:hypothetical protein